VSVLERITGKGEYTLRGKTEEGKWVEISKYDREVKWAEVREDFEEDLCDKYERIMLYDKRKRRPLWVRNCKPPISRVTSMTQALSTAVTTMMNTVMALMNNMIQIQNTMLQMMTQTMSNKPSLADELAHAYQMMKVAKLLAGEATGGKGGGDELDRIFMLIDRLRGLQPQTPQPSTPQPQPQAQSRELPPELRAKLEEIDREVQKAYEEIAENLDEALAVCREVEGEECEPEAT
jgi:hypothetical protein